MTNALCAHQLPKRPRLYRARRGNVGQVIIDEFTGRMMEGRRFSDSSLHLRPRKAPLSSRKPDAASVTFQNYFRLYDKLSGMTGTALTEAEES